MPEDRELEKQLKLVSKTGKYIVGRREVMSGLKGSKLLVWSASANLPQSLLDESKGLSIPAVKFNGNPVDLGRTCGIPFRVSVIAVKSLGDADIGKFSSASDYATSATTLTTTTEPNKAEEKESSKAEEAKPSKKKKSAKSETEQVKPTRKKKAEAETEEKEVETKSSEKPKRAKKPKATKKSEDDEEA